MIINEKALVRAMKDAAKTGGYRIQWGDDGETVTILCVNWLVQISTEKLPRKVLGLIAEQFEGLPDTGTYTVTTRGKDEIEVQAYQEEFFKTDAAMLISGVPTAGKWTGINYMGYSLYKTAGDKLLLINPELLRIAGATGYQARGTTSIEAYDADSAVFITAGTPEDYDGAKRRILEELEKVEFNVADEAPDNEANEEGEVDGQEGLE